MLERTVIIEDAETRTARNRSNHRRREEVELQRQQIAISCLWCRIHYLLTASFNRYFAVRTEGVSAIKCVKSRLTERYSLI